MPESITSIGDNACCLCIQLTDINIPASVTYIGSSALYDTRLTSVTIPDGITSIDSNTFAFCYTPHVCRHTYCSNQAKAGMNPKTLQYLMGHSDISVTMNVYTHIGFDDAEEELKRMEEFRKAQAEVENMNEKPMSQKMFKAI